MRLFVALEIPDKTRTALAELVAGLKPKCPLARWVRPEGMHVTLKFIGHVPPESLPAIHKALARIHSAGPIEIQFRGLGFFPSDIRPRVFWCGVQASANAAALAAEMDRALATLGVEQEGRPFAPHLTLARFKEDEHRGRAKHSNGIAEIVSLAREMQAKDFGALSAREFHLFESKTKPSGAEYSRLDTFHFTEAAH